MAAYIHIGDDCFPFGRSGEDLSCNYKIGGSGKPIPVNLTY